MSEFGYALVFLKEKNEKSLIVCYIIRGISCRR